MAIYRKKHNKEDYRKIYEEHYGSIPTDDTGRTYEIHHIDGNHSNNSPSNLKAVTIEEHYEIHKANGDWSACLLISSRMKVSAEKKSELSRLAALKRLAEGTHHYRDPEFISRNIERQKKLIEEENHPFQQEEIKELTRNIAREVQNERIKTGVHQFLQTDVREKAKIASTDAQNRLIVEGKHIFQDETLRKKWTEEQINNGTHVTQNSELQRSKVLRRIENGTHPWIQKDYQSNLNKKLLNEGKHPSQQKIECPFCAKIVDSANFGRWHGNNCKFKSP
jgi:hypothetical protein